MPTENTLEAPELGIVVDVSFKLEQFEFLEATLQTLLLFEISVSKIQNFSTACVACFPC